ncbi:hypothetical protein [Streptomyces sp. NPDC015350]|uniref:hypothetical protein n=1 Tax=Streptomyces sp. NPDC015350 TaxID=3364955 RepID=UPI0036F8E3AB
MWSGASTEPPRAVLERLRAVDRYGGLDALNAGAVGRITYCAKAGEGRPRNSPRGVLRRCLVDRKAETHDEVFSPVVFAGSRRSASGATDSGATTSAAYRSPSGKPPHSSSRR